MSQRLNAARLFPRSFRKNLRLEWLEDRTTPTTLFVDDSLVAGTAVGSLSSGVSVTQDRGTIGVLDDGDRVSIAVGQTGTTANLTFRATTTAGSTTAAAGDAGVAYTSIQAAVDAALADGLTDVTIEVANGTYVNPVTLTNPAAKALTQFTLDGLSGTATDVVIDPATAAAGVTLDTTAAGIPNVTISDVQITGGTTGVAATGVAGALTLRNVQVGTDVAGTAAAEANTGVGLQLAGTGAAGTTLTLDGVTVAGGATAKALDVSGFATVNLNDLRATAKAGAPQSSIALPAALSNATVNVTAGGTATTVTATGTSLQVGTAGETIALANVDALNLTGGAGADTFVVTPAATGGAVITVTGGAGKDTLDLTSTTGLTASATAGAAGFSGSFTSGGTAAVNFSNLASFADGSTITGRVAVDADKSGTVDANEGGLGGVTVYLDLDGSGTLNAGDVSTTTDAAGNFSFGGLLPLAGGAPYTVRITAPTGATLTSAAAPTVSITSLGQATTPLSFVTQLTAGGTVSGTLFNDANKNGTQNGGEAAVSGATVFLDLNANGTKDANEPSAVADANGAFVLNTTQNGTFAVRAAAPLPGGLALPATLPTATLSGGGTVTQSLGLVAATAGGTVSGVVFNDANKNGVKDAGEAGAAGVTVFLDVNANGTKDAGDPTATTDATGAFTLTAGTNGTFSLRVSAGLPTGLTAPAALPNVSVTGGGTVTQNLGLVAVNAGTTGGTATGFVFADVNPQNGTKDPAEVGVRGLTVFLDLNGDGKLSKGEPTAVTDASGGFTLSTTQNTPAAAVRVVLSPGYLRSTTAPTANLTGGATVSGVNIGVISKLPPQATPARRLAAGYVTGGKAHVKLFDSDGTATDDVTVFAGLATQDVRVAVADVTGDGVDDVIVGTGPGVPTQVIILDGTTLQQIAQLTPFESTFTGGVYVAAGDLTGDGINDVIVTPDEGGGPRVLVYQGGAAGGTGSFQQVASFFGIDDANFRGGARASVGDVNRDGRPDLVVAAGFGGGPRVAVFDGGTVVGGTLTRLFNDFFIFEDTLRNGAFITAGDVDGDGFADIIAGGGPSGGPRVLALSGADLLRVPAGQAKQLVNFFAGDPNNRGGVRVAAKDLNGTGTVQLVVGSGKTGNGKVQAINLANQSTIFEFDSNADNLGGVFVG